MKTFCLILAFLFSKLAFSQVAWYPLTNTIPSSSQPIDMALAPNGDVYMICYNSSLTKLYKSVDEGKSWVEVETAGLPNYLPRSMTFSGSKLVVVLQALPVYYVYASTDNGANWLLSTNGIPSDQDPLYDVAQTGSDLYLTAYKSTGVNLFRSLNNGAKWSVVTMNGLPSSNFIPSALGSFNANLLIGTGTNHIYRSTDSGQNWTSFGSSAFLGSYTPYKFAAANGSVYTVANLISSSPDVKLFKSADGSAWAEETMTGNEDLTFANSILCTKSGALLMCGMKTGALFALYTTSNPAGVTEQVTRQPFRVYPNPAKDKITLAPANVAATVKIISITGQVVQTQTVTDGTISVAHLPGGLYLLQAATEGGIFTAKFVKE